MAAFALNLSLMGRRDAHSVAGMPVGNYVAIPAQEEYDTNLVEINVNL